MYLEMAHYTEKDAMREYLSSSGKSILNHVYNGGSVHNGKNRIKRNRNRQKRGIHI